MTANMIKGKGFGGALRYNLEKVDKGVAEILDSSFVDVAQRAIMKEMQMVKSFGLTSRSIFITRRSTSRLPRIFPVKR